MTTISYSPTHPILFIADYSNEHLEVPEYNRASVIAANQSCVSVRTISDVDSYITVSLTPAPTTDAAANGIEVFLGMIDSPSRRVAVVTSHNERLLAIDVGNRTASIRVLVNEEDHPSRIWIEAR
jgi:hypothetical protein